MSNEIKEMKIVYKNIEELKPYENNPRINDEAVEPVANSIKAFGFKVPIIIDKNNVIVAGHTRYKASQLLKLKKVPCIIANDLTEEQVKACRLADNKVSEKSEWNFELLDEELKEITSIDMSDFDFDINFDDDIEDTNPEMENKELDLDEYDDDKFNVKCPKCGFSFNIKEGNQE